jgi:signal transduction histidine kinase
MVTPCLDRHTVDVTKTDSVDSTLTLQQMNELLDQRCKRVAHALHDEAGQLLAAVFLRLKQAADEVSPGCETCFDEIKLLLDMVESQLRDIAHDLHPRVLDDLGLIPAIEGIIDRFSKRYGIMVTCKSTVINRLSAPVEIALYRIVQECLNNVIKHAQATEVGIQLTTDGDQVKCLIVDNGVGFDPAEVLAGNTARGMGLPGIRERATSAGGTLAVHSVRGCGTTLLMTIPQYPQCGVDKAPC